jgi:hypothetical protein
MLVAVAFLGLVGLSHSTVSEIESDVKSIDSAIGGREPRVFGDVSEYRRGAKEQWRSFKNLKAMDKYQTKMDIYAWALYWTDGRGRAKTSVTFSSPSGDWAQFVDYYFRTDGSLMKVDETLNTFNGSTSAHKRKWFSSSGKVLGSNTVLRELGSGKVVAESSFNDHPATVYKTRSQLPFSRLIKASK